MKTLKTLLKGIKNYLIKKIVPKEIHLTWLCLLAGLFLIYYIFIQKNVVSDVGQKIAFIIASFGVLFSIIQFWINSIRHRDDFIKNMRYDEYKRVREIINSFFNSLSENMGEKQNIHLLSRQLMDIKNELVVIMQMTNKSIFKGILENEAVIEFGQKSDTIILRTDQLRYKIDEWHEKKKVSEDMLQFAIEVEIMNWHNEIREIIKELHILKYRLFDFMEDKII
jgi:hypothetical protein